MTSLFFPFSIPLFPFFYPISNSEVVSYLTSISGVFSLMSKRLLQEFSSTLIRISFGTCSDLLRISFGSDRTRSEGDPYEILINSVSVSKQYQRNIGGKWSLVARNNPQKKIEERSFRSSIFLIYTL